MGSESDKYDAVSSEIPDDHILVSSDIVVTAERHSWVDGLNGR